MGNTQWESLFLHPNVFIFLARNITKKHPRDLLRTLGRKTPDFVGILWGAIRNVKIIYWKASIFRRRAEVCNEFIIFFVTPVQSPLSLHFQLSYSEPSRQPLRQCAVCFSMRVVRVLRIHTCINCHLLSTNMKGTHFKVLSLALRK